MLNRRELIASAAASTAFSPLPLIHTWQDRPYRTALVGCGWWGMNILRCALESGACRAVALCDVDRRQRERAIAEVEKLTGSRPALSADYREMLQREKPDICIVATPDHWHPLITIAAVKAGAHVYVEKPVGHTVREGRAMTKAARDSGRAVQVGLHRRVSPHHISAMEFLRAGRAGKVGMVRAFVHYPGGPGTPTPDSEPPEGLDWDMWCGPAPHRPFNRAIHPRGFRQFLDFANGQLGDWGVHWLDQILWWNEEKGPRKVYSTGGRYIRRDSTDAPDTQVVAYEFESHTVTWEHRQYAGNEAERTNVGCYFYGTEGTLHLGFLDGWTFYPARPGRPTLHEDARLNKPDDQNIRELWADFLQSIRTGHRPVCDIESGHRSTAMALLGMLSLKLGRSVAWDPEKEIIPGDAAANRLLARPYRAPWQYPKT